ncbi:Rhodanese domain-containing protein, partial [Psidium guajava]
GAEHLLRHWLPASISAASSQHRHHRRSGRGEELRWPHTGVSALRQRRFLRQDGRSRSGRQRERHPRLPLRFKPGSWPNLCKEASQLSRGDKGRWRNQRHLVLERGYNGWEASGRPVCRCTDVRVRVMVG